MRATVGPLCFGGRGEETGKLMGNSKEEISGL